ncbi:nucleoside diphosphate-linked moiety X motif 6 isoform X2 [Athalia rosae]|uniref:nucleoside diphosphate-linked moiety X motif 6 isoform X2 n=1 Tax=Athalia rosae TaxID=37344 RepID=UPI002033201E|nr:nucleoside diphosphate-linked moiety X motif 6 isoform X2 [Athalia rosae]
MFLSKTAYHRHSASLDNNRDNDNLRLLVKIKFQIAYAIHKITIPPSQWSIKEDQHNCDIIASLDQWIAEERRAIWFRVNLEHSDWIPVLTKNGFQFHHAKNEYVTLYRWLPVHQSCNVPPYAHTLLGVGALVFNENTEEVLVVKEKYSIASQMWKLPGGYVEPGEDIAIAAQREVMEETGIEAEFKQLLLFRHAHHFAFDCSDIYMVVCLTPRTLDITRCEREIAHCTWMKLEEYVNHPEVHEHNRLVARKFIELRSHKTGVVVENMIHPSLKKPVSIFSISKMEN